MKKQLTPVGIYVSWTLYNNKVHVYIHNRKNSFQTCSLLQWIFQIPKTEQSFLAFL